MELVKGKYVVGVSGGIDSMVLLHWMMRKGYEIVVCHVNYHLRKESSLDQELVVSFCHKYQIECLVKELNEPIKGNIQSIAREIRYEWMAEVAHEKEALGIVVGHHLNDALETYLMQKERGFVEHYGLISGVLLYGVKVYRPMLDWTRKDIVDYANSYSIDYREDQSNKNLKYKRNQKRKLLENIDLDGLKKQMDNDNEELEVCKQSALELFNHYGRHGILSVQDVKDANIYFWNYYFKYHGVHIKLKSKVYDSIAVLLQSVEGNKEIRLNSETVLMRSYDRVQLVFGNEDGYCYVMDEGEVVESSYFELSKKGDEKQGLYLKKEDYPITIRTYRAGDKIELTIGHKKVSRLFIDAKIPLNERHTWPLVFDCEGRLLLIPKIAKNKHQRCIKSNLFVIQ